ncbi:MAG: class II fumarate hydratase [Planctomycetes bacterium]|nr:class II fumarate hydratase [Planctomycetota bacterium]
MSETTRVESDSMGEVALPAEALYGAQTARAAANFPVSGRPMPPVFIKAVAAIKQAAAEVNGELGLLDERRVGWIATAAAEIIDDRWADQFPVDVFQTGSGTSTNMNVNEVIANRAIQLAGGAVGSRNPVHPNDHVNMGQSSNDVIPSALHVAAASEIRHWLLGELHDLARVLMERACDFDGIVKIGRTHLQDAVPVRLGQEFSGYATAVRRAIERLDRAADDLCELPIGGTAVGTGLNTHPQFASGVCSRLGEMFEMPFREASDHFAAQSNLDAVVAAAGALKGAALTLGKIASDIRLLASGPRCGIGELELPAIQPGSSIMPGKVNPVICESVVQVACQIVGCEAAVAAGATGGVGSILELNMAMPVIAVNLLDAIVLLANVAEVFRVKCLEGLKADARRCGELVERSLALCTALATAIGYDAAAAVAKEAYATGQTVRQVARARQVLPDAELDRLLDPRGQTGA